MKTMLHRLFGLGRIPAALAAELQHEGVIAQDEGIRCWLRADRFRRPGLVAVGMARSFTGAIALTGTRIIALRNAGRIINVPFTDERIRQLTVDLPAPDTLRIAFDSSKFHPDWSGTLAYTFRTPRARLIHDTFHARIAQ